MKQYIGKKMVQAEPMEKGVAYYHNLLKRGVAPRHDEVDLPGYHVVYKNGYESWCPADVFEKSYKLAETFQDRLIFECDELYENHQKAYQESIDNKHKMDSYSLFLLKMQIHHMTDYYNALSNRISKEVYKNHVNSLTMDFGGAIKALRDGYVVQRMNWEKNKIIVKQQYCLVDKQTIPNMKSLSESAKELLLQNIDNLEYTNQILLVFPDGRADSYIPSTEDIFATDWVVVLPNE